MSCLLKRSGPEPESLWLPTPTAETPDDGPAHYPKLQQIIVQPSSLPRFRGLGFYKDFVRWLWESQPTARVPMYLIPADKGMDVDQRAKQERCSAKVKELWLAGVEGSLRCWGPDETYAHLVRSRGDVMPLYLTPWLNEPLVCETPPVPVWRILSIVWVLSNNSEQTGMSQRGHCETSNSK